MPTPEISKESSRLESGDGNMSGHGFLLEQPKKIKKIDLCICIDNLSTTARISDARELN